MKGSDYVKINNVNPLNLIIDKVDGFIEEKNRNKFLTLVSADKNKKVLIKYTELWNKIKNLIKSNSIDAIPLKQVSTKKDFMKIKFNSDDNLPLNKILKIHNMTIVIRSVLQEDEEIILKFF